MNGSERRVLWYPPQTLAIDLLEETVNWLDTYHKHNWTKDDINQCHCIFFHQHDEIAALIWLHWITPTVLEAHICVSPSFRRGRWALRNELEAMMGLQKLIEPPPFGVIAHVASIHTAKILHTLGFTLTRGLPLAYIQFKENIVYG